MVATLEINALFKGGTKQLKKGQQKAGSQAKKLGSQAKKATPKGFPVAPGGSTRRGPGGRYQNGEILHHQLHNNRATHVCASCTIMFCASAGWVTV